MLPFFPPIPNQAQPQQSSNNHPSFPQSKLQHPPSTTQHSHHQFVPSPMPGFNNQGGPPTNFPGTPSFPGPSSGALPMNQNLYQHGLSQGLALLLQQNMSQLLNQQNLLGFLQNPNLVAPVQLGSMAWPQHMNQMLMGLPNGQFGFPNLMVGSNPISPAFTVPSPFCPPSTAGLVNSAFVGNSQVSSSLKSEGQISSLGLQASSKNLQQPIPSSPMKAQRVQNNMRPNATQQFQGRHAADGGTKISQLNSGHSKGNNCSKKFHGHELRETSVGVRSQNSPSHHLKFNGSNRTQNRNFGKGHQNFRERNNQFPRLNKDAGNHPKRCLRLSYTVKEIHEWIEARRKNFPTRANIVKKLARCNEDQVDEGEARLRREQMKEILAKQVELGVPVAELPPGYLSEGDNQASERRHNRKGKNQRYEKDTNQRYRNRYNKRGAQRQDHRQTKKHKVGMYEQNKPLPKREPSLLQKLLSSDIKRDKSKLLQVFRFMVLNSFFKDWPNKPLDYPNINAKNEDYDGAVGINGDDEVNEAEDRSDSNASDCDDSSDVEIDGKKPADGECAKSEEGELTE